MLYVESKTTVSQTHIGNLVVIEIGIRKDCHCRTQRIFRKNKERQSLEVKMMG